jgi:hypothetical protein
VVGTDILSIPVPYLHKFVSYSEDFPFNANLFETMKSYIYILVIIMCELEKILEARYILEIDHFLFLSTQTLRKTAFEEAANSLKKTTGPMGGTFLILLANPDSHFFLQKPIYIMGDAGLKTQDAEDSFSFAIQCLESCVLSLESCV